jgi:signal transduction histidine kinase/CheY-like chemotaxis protein
VSDSELETLREQLSAAREELLRERTEREAVIAQMRDANEQLVFSTLRWESMGEQLATALDVSGTGTFRCDSRTGAVVTDHNLRELFGLIGTLEDLMAVVDPEDREALRAGWRSCISGDEDLAMDVRVAVPERGSRWVSINARSYLGDPDQPSQVIGACVDITDRKRVAEERAANRAKDEFLAILGHELRNPLAPILTALHLMRDRDGAESTRREREVIERQVEHLVRLVDDLLDVSRIATGKITLEPERLDLEHVVRTAIELSSSLFEQRGHRLEVDVRAGELLADADPARLTQVLSNLLTNAAKYTPPGGHIIVSGRRDGDFAVIEVADDGIGIPPHLVPRVFDLFVQGERMSDRRDGGLGIGLSIVKSLVAMHGGTVSAASAGPGQGSVFTVRLLAASPVEEIVDEVTGRVHRLAPIGQRVLFIDDNTDVADMVAELLREQGHTVEVAYDGAAALRLAETFRPQTALVDIGLPIMDGYELAANLRERLGSSCPRLIAVTGYGQARDRAQSHAAGFDLHLVKPVDVHRLLEVFADIPTGT